MDLPSLQCYMVFSSYWWFCWVLLQCFYYFQQEKEQRQIQSPQKIKLNWNFLTLKYSRFYGIKKEKEVLSAAENNGDSANPAVAIPAATGNKNSCDTSSICPYGNGRIFCHCFIRNAES